MKKIKENRIVADNKKKASSHLVFVSAFLVINNFLKSQNLINELKGSIDFISRHPIGFQTWYVGFDTMSWT